MFNNRWLPVVAALTLLVPLAGAGPSFRPDGTLKGSTLSGWRLLGQADWRAENGEVIGVPRASKDGSGAGGLLMLDQPYQDLAVYASFRCAAGCRTGILLRLEKTATGMKGVYVSLTDPDVAAYRVTLDAQGQIVQRERMRQGGGQMRIAPPPDPNAQPAAGRGGRGGGRGRGPLPANIPLAPPDASLRAGDWNTIEINLDANIVRNFLNQGGEIGGGIAEEDAGRYGPFALYVEGTGEVRFKDLSWKDLGLHVRTTEKTSPRFWQQKLSDFYYSWGAGAADFNHDGVTDVVAGPYIYFGPDYMKSREIYMAHTSNPSTEYTQDVWMQFTADFTGDGWPDVINANFSGPDLGVNLYVNPRGENRRWDKFKVIPAYQSEIGVLRDVDGDGKPELVYMAQGFVRYAQPDPAKPTEPWVVHTVSEAGFGTAHGIGVGDINGDGRMDITNAFGWWEQPVAGGAAPWMYHPQAFARYGRNIMGGSVMGVYDVNGDGLNDVVTVLNVHGWGLAWYEQKRDSGTISFVQHMVMDDLATKNAGNVVFSQPHGSTFADVDGDGIPDFVVGKRYWSHRDDYLDPDPHGEAVLYYYKTVRNPKAPGGGELVPELINNHTGTGSDVFATDLNKDGAMDIVTTTRFGTFIFWGTPRKR